MGMSPYICGKKSVTTLSAPVLAPCWSMASNVTHLIWSLFVAHASKFSEKQPCPHQTPTSMTHPSASVMGSTTLTKEHLLASQLSFLIVSLFFPLLFPPCPSPPSPTSSSLSSSFVSQLDATETLRCLALSALRSWENGKAVPTLSPQKTHHTTISVLG